ncbi:hypothetical protein [Devosia sp. 1635]|uniref:hypothetical protein n=1 Tax=Devosia sp. 1635 TaxID=2726066 RepID=UPI0015649149|nr:hypothetical protein [Devosia sp. 1635]
MKNTIVYLIGHYAVVKLTIGRAIEAQTPGCSTTILLAMSFFPSSEPMAAPRFLSAYGT